MTSTMLNALMWHEATGIHSALHKTTQSLDRSAALCYRTISRGTPLQRDRPAAPPAPNPHIRYPDSEVSDRFLVHVPERSLVLQISKVLERIIMADRLGLLSANHLSPQLTPTSFSTALRRVVLRRTSMMRRTMVRMMKKATCQYQSPPCCRGAGRYSP